MDGPDFVFAHLADAHVGAWPRDPAVRTALRESVLRALEVVEQRECEFLLISGDLFHTPVPDPAEVAPVAAALKRLTEHGRRIYVIYGSHDYVAHRTSWLDVLAVSGLFVRAAPAAVRAEGDRWTLPFLTDGPTGARIAGISGRAQGLDRSYFLAVDSEAFRQSTGFKIFQFHTAVQEFLPDPLRRHIGGVSVEELPLGCDYYAGGHIHSAYSGRGPGGEGLLVNPGAVFGTSRTDLENAALGRTPQGVAVVTVRRGIPTFETVRTAPDNLRIFDVDLSGESVETARVRLDKELDAHLAPGALLFPKVHGTLTDGSAATLGLRRSGAAVRPGGASAIHWDVTDLTAPVPQEGSTGSPDALEREALGALEVRAPAILRRGDRTAERLRELLEELGTEPGEGESRSDYAQQRIDGARRALGLLP